MDSATLRGTQRDVIFQNSLRSGEDQAQPQTPDLRLIQPSRSLPGNRSVVGGFLIAVAAIGTFAVATNATKSERQPVVVAAHDLDPGTRIQASDLRVIHVATDDQVQAHTLSNPQSAIGKTVLGPTKTGEFLQIGDLSGKANEPTLPQVSFAIPTSRALGGDIHSGETVDIVTTTKNASDTSGTTVAVHDAVVVRVDQQGGGLGKSSEVIITLATRDTHDAQTIISAVDIGQITLIRTTGLPD